MAIGMDSANILSSQGLDKDPENGLAGAAGLRLERDALTGVLDRNAFKKIAIHVIDHLNNDATLAVLDLDNFKIANDTFGHTFGDEYLTAFGRSLLEIENSNCFVGRLGGDEFAILFLDDQISRATAIMNSIRKRFLESNADFGKHGFGGVSIGQVRSINCEKSYDSLYHDADVALYAAKEAGRNKTILHNEFIRDRFDLQHQKELLVSAIDQGFLYPAFQPIVRLPSREIIGFEAIARLSAGDGKIRRPKEFLVGTREFACARLLSKVTLDRSLNEWQYVRKGLPRGARLSLNVTRFDIMDQDFLNYCASKVFECALDWSDLTIEITESHLSGPDKIVRLGILEEFQMRGVKIALGEFGLESASLANLSDWPVDMIKIDHRLTGKILEQERATHIISCIQSLALGLGIEVIAEGVENEDMVAALVNQGITLGKGLHLGKPKSASMLACFSVNGDALKKSRQLLSVVA